MLKPDLHHFYHIYWSLFRQLGWKKSLLVIFKILELFVKTLNTTHKYSLLNRENLKKQIQMKLSQKQKVFSQFVSAFLKSRLTFKQFQKKMTVIADVFRKLKTPETWLNKCLKSPVSEDHGKGDQTMLKSEWHQLYIIFLSLCRQVSWKKSLLVKCKVLRKFVNILTADYKCFLLNTDNLREPIQMQSSQKQKIFSQFFFSEFPI